MGTLRRLHVCYAFNPHRVVRFNPTNIFCKWNGTRRTPAAGCRSVIEGPDKTGMQSSKGQTGAALELISIQHQHSRRSNEALA